MRGFVKLTRSESGRRSECGRLSALIKPVAVSFTPAYACNYAKHNGCTRMKTRISFLARNEYRQRLISRWAEMCCIMSRFLSWSQVFITTRFRDTLGTFPSSHLKLILILDEIHLSILVMKSKVACRFVDVLIYYSGGIFRFAALSFFLPRSR